VHRSRLGWGQELYFDETKVQANADIDTMVPRFYFEAKQQMKALGGLLPTFSTGWRVVRHDRIISFMMIKVYGRGVKKDRNNGIIKAKYN